jgi:hypothetical protein
MTNILAGLERPRLTFFIDGMASWVVSVRFCSGTVRSD